VACALAALAVAAARAPAAPTVVDFEPFPSETVLTTQLAAQGVTFPQGIVVKACSPSDCISARSGAKVAFAPGFELSRDPFEATFAGDQQQVSVWVRSDFPFSVPEIISATITAYDLESAEVGSETQRFSSAADWTELSVASATGIRRVVVESGNPQLPNGLAYDDLSFDAGAPPPATAEAPGLTGLLPTSAPAHAAGLALRVTGSGFVPRSVVTWNGGDRPTTFLSDGELEAAIPASDLATPGIAAVGVRTPPPGGGAAAEIAFPVRPGPADPPLITGVSPSSDVAPGDLVTITGLGFGGGQGDSRVTFGGVSAGEAPAWSDERVQVLAPNVAPGAAEVRVVRDGLTSPAVGFGFRAAEPEPPTANALTLPEGGRAVLFDASLAIDAETLGGPRQGLSLKELGPGIRSVLWRFGDGTSSSDTVVRKTYRRPGTYQVSLTVTDGAGRSSTSVRGVTVSRGAVRVPPANISIPSKVVFDVGSATVREESKPFLRRLAGLVRRVGRPTEVQGHSDSTGPAAYNQSLSERRARNVRAFLVDGGGVLPELLSAVGLGETQPVASNATALGRQLNRRVVLRIDRAAGGITLTRRQLLINQRISQAAIRRERAIRRRLDEGLTAADIRDGSLGRSVFGAGVSIVGAETAAAPGSGGRPIAVPAAAGGSGGRVTLSARQLLINQRVAQAAVRRVNELTPRLDAGLTGEDVQDGAVTAAKLAPGLSVASALEAAGPPAAAPAAGTAPIRRGSGRVRLSIAQLATNQRISQAAVRRLNAIRRRIEDGVTERDFRGGALGARDLSPEVRAGT